MNEYYIKGELKDIVYFLQNGWKAEEYQIIDLVDEFSITYEELNAELELKEIQDWQLHLELQDENGTQYKKEWFEKLDYGDFYSDRLEYMKDVYYNIEYSEFPNLWVFYTNVRGYDTYDSGVFSAWSESRARELAEEKSKDFKSADIEVIGLYNKPVEEEICCSFNAG